MLQRVQFLHTLPMIKLYSGPLSLFTGKVRIVLAEKGIEYERIEVPFDRLQGYEPKHPIVAASNPKQQVPVLVDGGLTLYDSTLINEYLEDAYPTPALFPKGATARARCRQLELHADEVFFSNVLTLIREVYYKPNESERDAALVQGARANIERIFTELDALLQDREWFCDEFGVADITYALVTLFASTLGSGPSQDLTNFQAWFARTSQRPLVANEIREVMEYARGIA